MSESSSPWPLYGLAEDVRPALRNLLAAGRPAALATITGLSGGGPRPVGAQMVVGESVVSGFLSGGCVEADVTHHAESVVADGRPRRLVYGEGSPWPDIRLMCGAQMHVLLDRLGPPDAAARSLFALTDARRPALWLSDGERRACAALDAAPEAWPGAVSKIYWPAPRLIVFGADTTALAVADLGAQAGWETTLVRPRGPAEPPPLPAAPAAVGYRRDEPAEALASLGLDRWTAVAVATHDADLDHDALTVALPSEAFYVGALGARRRRADRVARLAAAGVSERDLGRLHSPIGLDLGGKAPWDVAIGVLAEITAERRTREAAAEAQLTG